MSPYSSSCANWWSQHAAPQQEDERGGVRYKQLSRFQFFIYHSDLFNNHISKLPGFTMQG